MEKGQEFLSLALQRALCGRNFAEWMTLRLIGEGTGQTFTKSVIRGNMTHCPTLRVGGQLQY